MQCVNLKERFGERYRVEYEESYYAEYGAKFRFGHGAEGARGAPECDLDRQAPWPSRGPSGKRGSRTVNKPRP